MVHYSWKHTDRGAPYRVVIAKAPQILAWAELAHARDWPRTAPPFLLWRNVDPVKTYWCTDNPDCARCAEMRKDMANADAKARRASRAYADGQKNEHHGNQPDEEKQDSRV